VILKIRKIKIFVLSLVPVFGGGYQEAVAGQVGADPAVREPRAAHTMADY
jgi:hypothetical protein